MRQSLRHLRLPSRYQSLLSYPSLIVFIDDLHSEVELRSTESVDRGQPAALDDVQRAAAQTAAAEIVAKAAEEAFAKALATSQEMQKQLYKTRIDDKDLEAVGIKKGLVQQAIGESERRSRVISYAVVESDLDAKMGELEAAREALTKAKEDEDAVRKAQVEKQNELAAVQSHARAAREQLSQVEKDEQKRKEDQARLEKELKLNAQAESERQKREQLFRGISMHVQEQNARIVERKRLAEQRRKEAEQRQRALLEAQRLDDERLARLREEEIRRYKEIEAEREAELQWLRDHPNEPFIPGKLKRHDPQAAAEEELARRRRELEEVV